MPTGRELFVGLHAAVLRQESVRHHGLRAQHRRLDNTVVRQLGSDAVHVHADDGFRFGFHRWSRVLVHRRDLRAQTPGHYVVRDQHGLPDRNNGQLRSGLRVPLEDRGHAEHDVPVRVHPPHRVRELPTDLFIIKNCFITQYSIKILKISSC